MNSFYFYCSAVFVISAGVLSILLSKYSAKKPPRRGNRDSIADDPPGRNGLPLIGETLQFMAAINSRNGVYDFVRVRCIRYGRCFKTRIFGETHVFVSSTDSAKLILNDGEKFTKKYIRSIAELVGHRSVLCASHQNHKMLRSRLINLFSVDSLSSFVSQFDEQIMETLRRWETGSTIIVLNEALKITCKAMCKMLISLEKESEIECLQKEVANVCEAMLAFPWRCFPWTRFHKGLKARNRIIKSLENTIRERRRCGVWCDDLLQRLLTEEHDGGGALTEAEIQDNILTMMIAGQDTTASAMTWMVKFLDENPAILENLRKEQLQILAKPTNSTSSYLTMEDLADMSYAAKVVKESLRLASVVPWFPRLVLQDSEIQGFKINKGWNVNIDVRSIHSDSIIYTEPNIFNPSRFDTESKPYSFLAFGKGGRQCIGMNMAKAMMLIFLHRLVTSFRWKVIDSDSSIENWSLFSKLKSGCPAIVTRIDLQTTPYFEK